MLLLIVVAIFSAIRPDSYFTADNAQMIASTNAVLAILALAAVPPLVVGQFDLSIGFQLALSQSLCAGMIIYHGVPAADGCCYRARDRPRHRFSSTACCRARRA